MTGGAGRLAGRAIMFGAIAFSCAGAGQATAASRLCRQLQAELASATNSGRASPAQIRKYDSAIARQSEEMAKARSRAHRAGCGFSFFGGNVAACAALNASIERMNANLDTLRGQRARLVKRDTRRDRARILASLDAHDCRDTRKVETHASKKTATRRLLDDSSDSGGQEADLPAMDDEPDGKVDLRSLAELTFERAPHPQGEFRTMCVRTCDGYFFPMSNAASQRDFERDQKNCESSCPGTEMQVFYTRGIGDDPATMTSSVNGKPYSQLPTAYLYKKPGSDELPACGCNAAQGYKIIGGNSPTSIPQSEPESASITSFVPVPATKPESSSGKDAPTANETSVPPLANRQSGADRKIRVVAPAFLPDPKGAINLRVPAPKPTP